MVRRARRGAVRRRRSGRSVRRTNISRNPAVTRIPRTRSMKISTIRDLNLFTRLTSSSGAVSSSWLDYLAAFGSIALRLFVFAVSGKKVIHPTPTNGLQRSVLATVLYPTSAVQSIWIGAEDLLFRHAIIEFEDRRAGDTILKYPFINYRQAIVRSISAHITCGSPVSSRAGRFVACILNVVEEELANYMPSRKGAPWSTHDNWSFIEVAQMPGAIVAPYGRAVSLSWRPSPDTFARRALLIGQSDADGIPAEGVSGGKPVCRLVFGYQDFASNTGSTDAMYGMNELAPQISLRGQVELRERGKQFVRPYVPFSMDTSAVSYSTTGGLGCTVGEFPLSNIFQHESGLYAYNASDAPLSLEEMALE